MSEMKLFEDSPTLDSEAKVFVSKKLCFKLTSECQR